MYLKRIELTGFKSFARQSKLDFTTPITVVVGPNGSGKSNIAEAIRFVLGEQSMKSLRSKRGEDLIFNGSKTVARLNRAGVTITFDNSSRIFDLDYDEVEIKRVVFRDATNQYFINGNKVRLKDIIELLSSINIGVSSHHIISQGEADRILSASIKERRVMIEDALGLRIYHYKKNESLRKLAKTEDNIKEVGLLRREIAPHLKFLEKQVEKIRLGEELKIELKDTYKTYLQKESAYLRYQKEKIKEEKSSPKEELVRIKVEIEEKESALQKLDAGQEKSARVRELEEKLEELRDKKDSLSRQLGRLEGMLEYEERRQEKQKGRRENEDNNLEEDLVVSIPRKRLTAFVEEIKNLAHTGSFDDDKSVLIQLFEKIQRSITAFRGEYLHNTEGEVSKEVSLEDKEVSDYLHIKSQKEKVEETLKKSKEEEQKLLEERREEKEKIEKERTSERTIERALFDLRTRKTELVSRLELVVVKEERLHEEEMYFKEESTEAAHFVGVEVLRYEVKEGEFSKIFDEDIRKVRRDQEHIRKTIERMKIKIEDIGGGGEDVLKEYEEVKERDAHFEKETSDLEKSIESLNNLIGELAKRIDTEFKEGVEKINIQFQELFSKMFDGGSASIKIVLPPPKKKKVTNDEGLEVFEEVEDEDVEEGIDIMVELPNKRLKGLHMLSGGERALTSIALIFAITLVNPPPFLVLDETDAALDEANARKYGSMIEQLSSQTQFIIITHTRETMAKAQVLYGVTATADGISRLLSIRFDEAEQLAH